MRATDGLTINGGLTLLEAEYPNDCEGDQDLVANVVTLCGNTLTNAPQAVGILGATYEGNLGNDYTYFLNGSVRYESDRRTSTQAFTVPTGQFDDAAALQAAVDAAPAVPFDEQDSNTKINVRAGIGNEEGGWGIEAWATNITNEVTRGVTFNTTLRSGSRSAFIQDPRFYGVTVRKDF